jgi:hypothetical protein
MKENLDTIRIELEVVSVLDEQDVWMQGNIVIIINREKPYTEDDIVETEILFQSLEADGEYFIFKITK